jgi:hypothetical protein
MPVVSRDVSAVSFLDVNRLDRGVLEQRILLEIRFHELDWRIVIWVSFGTRVDPGSGLHGADAKVLVALVDTHHVLHGVGMRSCQSSVSVPVGDLIDIEEGIHDFRKLEILIHLAGWLSKTIIIVECSIFNLEGVQEFLERKVDSTGSLSEVSKPVVPLLLSPDDFVTSNFLKVSLIPPFEVSVLCLCVTLEQAWGVCLDMLVVEVLWGHGIVVALENGGVEVEMVIFDILV